MPGWRDSWPRNVPISSPVPTEVSFAFGAGVGPQFNATYRRIDPLAGITYPERTYRLEELSVTPLFQILLTGDIRAHRTFSFGPYFGVRNGYFVYGAMIRGRFAK